MNPMIDSSEGTCLDVINLRNPCSTLSNSFSTFSTDSSAAVDVGAGDDDDAVDVDVVVAPGLDTWLAACVEANLAREYAIGPCVFLSDVPILVTGR